MKPHTEHVLIYIANPVVAEVTGHRLELLGLRVTSVSDGKEMSDSITASLPDAVIIDLDFDQGAGLRWIESIASDECTSHIPVLCLSSRGDLGEVEQAYRAGAIEFLVSPFDPVDLENKLIDALQTMPRNLAAGEVNR
ncbi:response regulator [Roseiconus lacunae]|uniref:Response regulator n=1 Tax=Roseiconus lacunae TaxID=2605694 RepID=A0ABT7PJF8_9BACT|nr:response regulator [Roseiconus lacunae]MDM4016623.1 response regulator [Roseiconus lacunae]